MNAHFEKICSHLTMIREIICSGRHFQKSDFPEAICSWIPLINQRLGQPLRCKRFFRCSLSRRKALRNRRCLKLKYFDHICYRNQSLDYFKIRFHLLGVFHSVCSTLCDDCFHFENRKLEKAMNRHFEMFPSYSKFLKVLCNFKRQ